MLLIFIFVEQFDCSSWRCWIWKSKFHV